MPADARSTIRRGLSLLVTVAALLLGLVAMHSLGHPGGHSIAHSPAPGAAVHHVDVSPLSEVLPGTPDSGNGDLAAVMICLAVLAGFGLAVLFSAALSRHRAWAVPTMTLTAAPWWSRPPPRLAPLLSELSILRI